MLESVYLKTLRDHRLAIGAWGLGLGTVMALAIGLLESQTSTPEARGALLAAAQSFTWYSEPVDILDPGGYATWRVGPLLAVGPAIWGLLAGSRTLRGEEDRAALDVLLSVPRSRARVALEKLAALFTAAVLVGLLIGIVSLAGGRFARAAFGVGDALLMGLNVSLHACVFMGLSLLISQFTRERGPAAGLAGILLGLAFALDATARTIGQVEWVRTLSPMYYFSLSKPLVPGYGANPGAMVVLLGLAAAFGAAGVALFVRRDIGATVAFTRGSTAVKAAFRPRPRRAAPTMAAGDWSLRSLYARSVGASAAGASWWGLGIAVYAAWMTGLARQTQDSLAALYESSPLYTQFAAKFGGSDLTTSASYLSLVVFSFLPLLVVAFAATQANRWAADEEDGRLELPLAAPLPRPRVMLIRFAAFATAAGWIAALGLAGMAAAVAVAGVTVDGGRLLGAFLGLVPLALVVGAVGYLLAGWLRSGVVTGVLTALVASSFFVTFLGPLLNWPKELLQLSLFEQYGTPILSGLDWAGMLRLLTLTAAALAIATIRFARKDIAG